MTMEFLGNEKSKFSKEQIDFIQTSSGVFDQMVKERMLYARQRGFSPLLVSELLASCLRSLQLSIAHKMYFLTAKSKGEMRKGFSDYAKKDYENAKKIIESFCADYEENKEKLQNFVSDRENRNTK